jgi:hypothetical protein
LHGDSPDDKGKAAGLTVSIAAAADPVQVGRDEMASGHSDTQGFQKRFLKN